MVAVVVVERYIYGTVGIWYINIVGGLLLLGTIYRENGATYRRDDYGTLLSVVEG